MDKFKGATFGDRRDTSADAKKAALEKLKAKMAESAATFEEREAKRLEIAKARDARAAERKAIKGREEAERQAQLKAEQERLAAEAAEAAHLAEIERIAEADRLIALEAEQKAARDARYAARKDRQKKR